MALEGLWTVSFSTAEEEHANLVVSEEINRGGVIVFTGGKVYGGGISYYFLGNYTESGDVIQVGVKAIRYNELVSGMFGDVAELQMSFSGSASGDVLKLKGHLVDDPGRRLSIIAQRRQAIA
jgi:hypothetical protein